MVEILFLIVIVLQVGFWTGSRVRERWLRRDMAKSIDRSTEIGVATIERQTAHLARRLDSIKEQVDWLAERVSELRLEQMDREADRRVEDRVDFLKDTPTDAKDP